MKTMRQGFWSLMACALLPAAVLAASLDPDYERGLRLKQEQKLEAAAEAFALAVARRPEEVDPLAQLATVQAWLQRYEDSITSWRRALALAPERSDNRLGLARVLYWSGRREAALTELDTVLSREPGNADALQLKGDVLIAGGDAGGARQAYLAARALPGGQGDPQLEQKIARAVPPLLWRLDAGIGFDDYSNERGSENSQFVQLGYRLGEAGSVYLHWDRFNQFEQLDQTFLAGGYWQPGAGMLLQVEAGGTPDAKFKPDSQAAINGEFNLRQRWQPLLGLRYLKYGEGNVVTVTPGLRVLIAATNVELRYGYSDNIDGSNTGVTTLRIGFDPRENLAVYALVADGEEALPPQARASFTVLGAGGVLTLNPLWSLRADYSYEDREDFYRRNSIGVAVTRKF